MSEHGKKISVVTAIIIATVLCSPFAYGVSFNCAKASSMVEKLICSNDELSQLDSKLSVIYKKSLTESQDKTEIKTTQKQWVAERNNCSDIACIKIFYEKRIKELESLEILASEAIVGTNSNDYVREIEPQLYVRGTPVDDYPDADDPEVCDLYLQNLRYFVKRNEPLSCDQPVASPLKNKIQAVEWENLDPEIYPDLFKAVVNNYQRLDDPHREKSLSYEGIYISSRNEVKRGMWVFRRAKLMLKGFPAFFRGWGPAEHVQNETKFQFIQYGPNVLDTDSPNTAFRCKEEQARRMGSADQDALRIFVAYEDLRAIYGGLADPVQRPIDLWNINGRIYGESFDEDGDVHLSQLKLKPTVSLEPICLYHFRNVSPKGEMQ